jgi:hypothetical protein
MTHFKTTYLVRNTEVESAACVSRCLSGLSPCRVNTIRQSQQILLLSVPLDFTHVTPERQDGVCGTPASYSVGPAFKSRFIDMLTEGFHGFPRYIQENTGVVYQNKTLAASIHFSFCSLFFYLALI